MALVVSAPVPAGANLPESSAIVVTLLGTGTPVPNAKQYGASTLVEAGGQTFLFDCGRGCGIRLAQANPKLFNKVDKIFLTHLHSDHVVGLPEIWLNGWTQNRNTPFRIWGPVGTSALMTGLREAFSWDINIRNIVEKVPAATLGLDPVVSEIVADGEIYDYGGVRITAFLVDHAEAKPAFGYRIDYAGHSVVLSGDTRPAPAVIKQATSADVLIHEVIPPRMITYLKANYSAEQVETVVNHHTTASQAARIFAASHPGLAVYSHYVAGTESDRELVAETRRAYAGHLLLGKDLTSISIGNSITICERDENCRVVRNAR